MAFFDKIGDFAKNIGDKTGDAIEISKLNSKINTEKNLAAEQWKKIGEFYYNLYINGGEVDPGVLEFCEAAKSHLNTAEEAKAEIERIKAENEAKAQAAAEAKAAAEAASAIPVAEAADNQQTGGLTCTECGAEIPEGQTSLKIPTDGFEFWSPMRPRLYTARVITENQTLDCRFGIRRLTSEGKRLYLNGKPSFFRGT